MTAYISCCYVREVTGHGASLSGRHISLGYRGNRRRRDVITRGGNSQYWRGRGFEVVYCPVVVVTGGGECGCGLGYSGRCGGGYGRTGQGFTSSIIC